MDGKGFKQLLEAKHKENYKNKSLHGQFMNGADKAGVDLTGTWTTSGLKIGIESLIVAAQEQDLNTKYFKKMILRQ